VLPNNEQRQSKKWFYVVNNQQHGPVVESELLRLFYECALNNETLVWTTGMDNWEKAYSIPEFSVIVPPAIPPKTPIDNGTKKEVLQVNAFYTPRPWIRYWARMIDIMTFSCFLGFFMGLFAPNFLEEAPDSIFGVITVFIWVFFEPLVLILFGNTLGKALLNTKIELENGDKITFPIAFKRSFSLWVKGLGLGIPIVNLICMVISKGDLQKSNFTKWDLDSGTFVTHGNIGAIRIVAVIILFIIFLFFISLA
jgi:uncharacterized RDD family membrane protein YckC